MQIANDSLTNLTRDYYYFVSYLEFNPELINFLSMLISQEKELGTPFDVILDGPYSLDLKNISNYMKSEKELWENLTQLYWLLQSDGNLVKRNFHRILESTDVRSEENILIVWNNEIVPKIWVASWTNLIIFEELRKENLFFKSYKHYFPHNWEFISLLNTLKCGPRWGPMSKESIDLVNKLWFNKFSKRTSSSLMKITVVLNPFDETSHKVLKIMKILNDQFDLNYDLHILFNKNIWSIPNDVLEYHLEEKFEINDKIFL